MMEKEDPGPSRANEKTEVRVIGITYNLRRCAAGDEPDDRYEEYDCIETVQSLKDTIEAFGFKVVLLEQNDFFFDALRQTKPDFIVNIAEGLGVMRGRESQMPAILESLGIPYAGSDSVACALALDKWLTHHMLVSAGLPVPTLFMFSEEGDLWTQGQIFSHHREYIVKPRWEGSSKGVFADSIVRTHAELAERVRRIWERYRQPAIVEEYLPGIEITVGVLGNRPPQVIGLMAVNPEPTDDGHSFYTLEHKRNWKQKVRYAPPEALSEEIRLSVSRDAVRCFQFLELKDIARIDFKLDRWGVPKIIDVNPLPGLSEAYSDLPILYRLSGGRYEELVRGLLSEAFARYGLSWPYLVEVKLPYAEY